MPRPKAFDQDRVLTAAMFCFWQHGYTATSMKDLEYATGLTPSSLYNSFGSKDELFLDCVDHYIDNVVRKRIHRFLESDDPVLGIKQFVEDCFIGKNSNHSIGCLLTNSATELGPHDRSVQQKVSLGMRLVQKALHKSLERAQQKGQLSEQFDSAQKAIHIGLLLNGMLVTAKVAKNNSWLDSALNSLDSILVSAS
jgi:TetR/AcrR family transcriptional regulator, transcriptional repressor for nem operon